MHAVFQSACGSSVVAPRNARNDLRRQMCPCGVLRPNIWPGEALPELEPAFKELGRLMMDVGLRLTEHCDQYVAQHGSTAQSGPLQQILLRSPCPKVSNC
jgi:hypothetical protein